MTSENARVVQELTARIRPMLGGYPPEIQSAVLADLLALWLAGHHVPGDRVQTNAARSELLANHWRLVHDLLPINATEIGTTV